MKYCRWSILVVAVALAVSVAAGFDGGNQKNKSTENSPNKANKDATKAPVTSEMEAAATSFVRQNHPELLDILTQLKSANPSQYQQAVRDLSRSVTMLAATEKNDPKRYVLDLKAWQVNSEVQVLAARLAMGRTPELEDKLKAKLVEQIDIRLQQQELERDRTAARLERIDATIAKMKQTREDEVRKAFDKLAKTTPKPGAKKESKATDAGAKKGEKSGSK